MNIRIVLFLLIVFIAGRTAMHAQTITFNADPNSPTIVNGHYPCLGIDSPAAGEVVDTLQSWCSGGVCTYGVEVEMHVDSFVLGDLTEGTYPCATSMARIYTGCDTCFKGNGHHVLIIIDNGPPLVVSNLAGPVSVPVPANTPGPHTIRAFMARSWDESIKDVSNVVPNRETSLYCVRTFYVDTNTGGPQPVDTTKPLLTPSSPLDTNAYVYPPDSVLLDFYMMFKDLDDGYVVEATVYDSTMSVLKRDTLDSWVPYCIGGLEEPPVGRLRKYFIRTRLLDLSGQPVTNGPGSIDFNDRTWAFWVRRN